MSRKPILFLTAINLLAVAFLIATLTTVAPPRSQTYQPSSVTDYSGPDDPAYLRAEQTRMRDYVTIMERLTHSESRFINHTVTILFIPTAINLLVLAIQLLPRQQTPVASTDSTS